MNLLNRDKETVSLYKRENRKLRKELADSIRELNAVRALKDDYQQLISQVKKQQAYYIKLNEEYEDLIKSCKEQLNEITKIS